MYALYFSFMHFHILFLKLHCLIYSRVIHFCSLGGVTICFVCTSRQLLAQPAYFLVQFLRVCNATQRAKVYRLKEREDHFFQKYPAPFIFVGCFSILECCHHLKYIFRQVKTTQKGLKSLQLRKMDIGWWVGVTTHQYL